MQYGESLRLTNRPRDATIAFSATGAVRVDRFLAHARTLADALPDHRYVINLISDRYFYLLGFCAATFAGQCTLMPPNRLPATLTQLGGEFPDCYQLNDDFAIGDPFDSDGRHYPAPCIPEDQLCAIAFTSGSTGSPKPNLKSWRSLRDGTRSNVNLLLDDSSERLNLVATVPPQHMWGMEMSILLPLFADVAISHRTPFFPGDIAEALADVPPPRALISSPVHLESLLRSGVELCELSRIFTATAPLSVFLARDLEARFGAKVTDVFGCSECGVMARRSPSQSLDWRLADAFELIGCNDGVLIRAKHMPEDVAMPDVVEMTDARHFRLIGRHQDMVNVAGKRGSLADLNQQLAAMPEIIDSVIFLPENGERLAAMVVAPDLSAADVLRYLRERIEPAFLPRPVYLVKSLPRQENGKLPGKMVLELFDDIRRANSRRRSGARS